MPTELVDRAVRLEVAAALRVTEYSAGRLMQVAEALAVRYPDALALLDGADTTVPHAEFIVDELDQVDIEVRERVRAEVIDLARTLTIGPFRRAVRTLIDTARADALTERHRAAMTTRRARVEPAGDGMAWFSTLIPDVEAQAIWQRLTAVATTLASPDETRTLDQRRADVFCDLLIDGETASLPDAVRGIRPTVTVTVPALTLLGHPDHGPALMDGTIPIPLDRARQLCGTAKGWLRVLTHPETGVVLSVGRTQYRPPADLQRFVKFRHSRCVAPGCGLPAHRCELDHTVAWEHGGHTCADNLAPRCAGHHTLKHHTDWTIRQTPDGAGNVEWISPAGRRYLVEPERRTPAFVTPDHSPPREHPPQPDDPPF